MDDFESEQALLVYLPSAGKGEIAYHSLAHIVLL